jgi:hypothetical protein
MRTFTTTNESMPTVFQEATRMLRRPYIAILKAESDRLDVLTRGHGDIVLYRGKRMTWGQADGGYALMPVVE